VVRQAAQSLEVRLCSRWCNLSLSYCALFSSSSTCTKLLVYIVLALVNEFIRGDYYNLRLLSHVVCCLKLLLSFFDRYLTIVLSDMTSSRTAPHLMISWHVIPIIPYLFYFFSIFINFLDSNAIFDIFLYSV
jgi:hypothetical protein